MELIMYKITIEDSSNLEAQEEYKELLKYCFQGDQDWLDYAFPQNEKRHQLFTLRVDGRLATALTVVKFDTTLFGKKIKMAGISAVGTSPEYRGNGFVRVLFETMYEWCRSQNIHISSLHPFKYQFYERLGYGHIGGTNDFELPPKMFTQQKSAGYTMLKYDQSDKMFDEFVLVYNQWVTGFDMGIDFELETREEFEKLLKFNKSNLFICYNAKGKAEGAIIVKLKELELFVAQIEIIKIAWTTTDAMNTLFNFLSKHRDQCKTVRWMTPSNFPMWMFSKEARVPHKTYYMWMFRPIDMMECIKLKLDYLDFKGSFEFSIKDPNIKENQATYLIQDRSVTKKDYNGQNEIPLHLFGSLYLGKTDLKTVTKYKILDIDLGNDANKFFSKNSSIFVSEFF